MYEIIITKKTAEKSIEGHEWEVVGEEPIEKDGELLIAHHPDGEIILRRVYGYTPEIVKEREVERLILKQTVDDLDLAAVIKAINKI